LNELAERVALLYDDEAETEEVATISADELKTQVLTEPDARPIESADHVYHSLPLTTSHDGELVVVGAVAIVAGPDGLSSVSSAFLQQIARNIYDSGDVRTVYLDARTPQAEPAAP
jgi:hypothetical protein